MLLGFIWTTARILYTTVLALRLQRLRFNVQFRRRLLNVFQRFDKHSSFNVYGKCRYEGRGVIIYSFSLTVPLITQFTIG